LGVQREIPTEEAVKEPQLLKAALKARTAAGEQCIWAILLTIGAVPPAK
jgi:hypothetical protein